MHLSHVCLDASRLFTFTTKTCSPQQTSFTRNRRLLATISGFLFIFPTLFRLFLDIFPRLITHFSQLTFARSPFLRLPRQRFFASRIIFVKSHIPLPTYFAWTSDLSVRTCLRISQVSCQVCFFSSLASSLVPVNSQASSKCAPARNPCRPGAFLLSKKKRMLLVRQDR